jgi:glycerol uptake facilitator-like aquaporin
MIEPLIPLSRRALSEALGTCLLLAAVVGSGIMAERLAGGNIAVALLCNAIATGAALVVLITMLGPISGAHFNPAVSLIETLRGRLSVGDAVTYILVQILAAMAGVLLAHAMFDLPLLQVSDTARTGTGQWLSESVATFGLILTILLTGRHKPEAVPVSVGLYIVSAYWFTASTSFANPAVTIARAMTDTFAGIAPGDVPAFIAAQLCGALAGWGAASALGGAQK